MGLYKPNGAGSFKLPTGVIIKMEKEKEQKLWHQSGVNQKGEAFVQLILNGKIICQMDVWKARDHATAIIEAAEAAETDAFLINWLVNIVKVDINTTGGLLAEFRRYREEKTGKKEGAFNPKDWIFPDSKEPK